MIVLTGFIHDNRIEINSVLRLETGPTLSGERLRGTVVELLDGQGQVLGRAPLRRMVSQASCGCGCEGGESGEPPSGVVQALLPDPGQGSTLQVVQNGETVWSRQAPSEPPTVSELTADTFDGLLQPPPTPTPLNGCCAGLPATETIGRCWPST